MKMKLIAVAAVGVVMPAGNVVAQSTATKITTSLATGVYNKKWAGDSLREVTRQRVVGANIAMAAAGVLLGAPNLSGAKRDDFVGRGEIRVKNPAKDILAEFNKSAEAVLAANPNLVKPGHDLDISMSRYGYSLIYQSKGEDAPYFVEFDGHTSVVTNGPAKGGFLKGDPDYKNIASLPCKFESAPRPLEEWQANDYAAVTALHAEVVKKCGTEFQAWLPTVLAANLK